MLQAMLAKYNQSIKLISVPILILVRGVNQLFVSRVLPMLLSHVLANIITSNKFFGEKKSISVVKSAGNDSITNSEFSNAFVVSTTRNSNALNSNNITNQTKVDNKISIETSSAFAANITRVAKILVNISNLAQQYLTETQSKILFLCRYFPIDNLSKLITLSLRGIKTI